MKMIQFPFPVFILKEGKWFVAECPILNIATQGRTEKEVKENIKDLIQEYLDDPDTSKEALKDISSPTVTFIPMAVSKELVYGRT
jgi:predicted RNase H-like HicB family nuclease